MMKNILIALNLLLVGAVGYLYYHNFSGKGLDKSSHKNNNSLNPKDSNCNRAHIAYVELDSMYENITYIKTRRNEIEAKLKRIETEWQSSMSNLKAKQDNFVKKGMATTQQEIEQFQNMLVKEQQQIEQKKQSQGQELNDENFKFNEDLQKKLKEFLLEYNKEKKYMYILTTGTGFEYLVYKDPALDITNDVIKGMNEKMNAKAK